MHIQQKNIAVFDLDNCLAEDKSRMHLINNGNKHGEVKNLPACPAAANLTWVPYHKAGAIAAPHHVDLFHGVVRSLPRHNGEIVFLTARPEMFSDITVSWLEVTGFASVPRWTLLMRKNDCLESSPVMKPRRLQEWLRRNDMSLDNVSCVYDDRRDVLQAFQALGVNTQLLAIEDRG